MNKLKKMILGLMLFALIPLPKYDIRVDYYALMVSTAKNGGENAKYLGHWYEECRNAKIDHLGLDMKKTSYFLDYSNLDDIYEKLTGIKKYSENDLDLLARLIYAEVGSDWIPDWVQRAAGSVVLNRVQDKRYPSTIKEVIYQPGQYGPVVSGMLYCKPTQKCINNARYILEHGSILPAGVIGQNGFGSGPIYKSYRDPMSGVTVYFCFG